MKAFWIYLCIGCGVAVLAGSITIQSEPQLNPLITKQIFDYGH